MKYYIMYFTCLSIGCLLAWGFQSNLWCAGGLGVMFWACFNIGQLKAINDTREKSSQFRNRGGVI